jgi:hypothetical protein
MMNAATKVELIKKIAALPESLPDESDAEILLEMQRQLAEINDILNAMLQHEEQRAKNWQTTVEAMEAARRGELVTVDGIEGLFADLHADD